MIFSASPTMALKLGDTFYFIKRHCSYLLLGMLALYYGMRLDLDRLKSRAAPVFIIAVILLLVIFIPGVGRKISGASRWIEMGFISFQPSELIKFALVLLLAKWLSENQKKPQDFSKGLLPPLLYLGLVSLLIMKQPDLGTVLVLGATVFSMLFIAGANLRHLAGLGLAAVAGVIASSLASPYRLRRFVAYFNPWQDPQGVGFHIIQSLLAVGSGGIFGLGLGASRQKFFYLPQQFTDFIFAILCEETGMLGAVVVVVLFVIFITQGFRIASSSADPFRSLLAAGLVSWLSWQATINIMVVLGLIPTTGIPLPFFSYGGTATIINLFSAGVILNVSRRG